MGEQSKAWLLACLDPYHDEQLDLEGLPDERMAPSVIQMHNQTVTLSIPASAAGGNWDASIMFSGVNSVIDPNLGAALPGMATVTSGSIHPYNSAGLSVGNAFGALNLWAGAAGSVMSTGAPKTVGDTYNSLGSVLSTDRCRLIGVAFEVHNTTAEVYKRGSLTVAQLPDCACDTNNIHYVDTAGVWTRTEVQADRAVRQASTVAPLLSVPGSQTWQAADGCYVIPRMTIVPRDIYSFAYTPYDGATLLRGASSRLPIIYGSDGKTATPIPIGGQTVTDTVPLFAPYSPSGFSPIQVFLSGLSAQTNLTVTFRTIVEYFPALNSPILPIASPSATFDPEILRLYFQIVQTAPYAVPVDQNEAGEYFRRILRITSDALVLVSPMFGTYAPVIKTLGQAGQGFSSILDKRVRKDEAGNRARAMRK
jgi:hypothetical protein